jgi:hypothetical protein
VAKRNITNSIFANDPLLVQVGFTDSNGKAQTVSRTIDFAGAVAKRGELLATCGLKDPYK